MDHSDDASAAESECLAEIRAIKVMIGYEAVVFQQKEKTPRLDVNRRTTRPGLNTRLPGWHT